jgi:NAD(P)-dependent dehydrogenase (short-subunit alcohol dehydrogenase family)
VIRAQDSIDSPRGPRECFFFTGDFRNLPAWDPAAVSAAKRTPGALGVGTEFDIVLMFGPHRLPMRYRIEEFEPPRRVRLVSDSETMRAVEEIRFDLLAGGTRVIYTTDIQLKKAGRLTETAIKSIVAISNRRAVAGLRRALAPRDSRLDGSRGWRGLLPKSAQLSRLGYSAARLRPIVERLDGKTAVVTGATSGIGRAVAFGLARLGARVVLVGRDALKLAQLKADIVGDSGNLDLAVQRADLSLVAETRALARRLLKSEKRIDLLINNAAGLCAKRELTVEGLEHGFALNLLSPYLLTEALLPELPTGARVINVAAGALQPRCPRPEEVEGKHGRYDGARALSAARQGLVALTALWAERAASRGVAVHAVHPGWVSTPGAAALPVLPRRLEPLRRSPEQGADTILWLAAAAAGADNSGSLWLDRRPRPIASQTGVLPGSAARRKSRRQLAEALENAAREAAG